MRLTLCQTALRPFQDAIRASGKNLPGCALTWPLCPLSGHASWHLRGSRAGCRGRSNRQASKHAGRLSHPVICAPQQHRWCWLSHAPGVLPSFCSRVAFYSHPLCSESLAEQAAIIAGAATQAALLQAAGAAAAASETLQAAGAALTAAGTRLLPPASPSSAGRRRLHQEFLAGPGECSRYLEISRDIIDGHMACGSTLSSQGCRWVLDCKLLFRLGLLFTDCPPHQHAMIASDDQPHPEPALSNVQPRHQRLSNLQPYHLRLSTWRLPCCRLRLRLPKHPRVVRQVPSRAVHRWVQRPGGMRAPLA